VSEGPPFERITWPVHTDRLTLRPATRADLPRLYALRSRPGVSHWLTQAPSSYDDYAARNDTPARLGSTLVVERGGELVGDLYLSVESPWSQLEAKDDAAQSLGVVGWCIDPAHAGQGLATEAAMELLRLLFDDLGVRRVVAGAFADNLASVRVMQKIGMRQETRGVRDQLHRELGWLDGVGYALLADEWRARQQRGRDGRLAP
jgi:RimJ/RimL family protein N-acetyltransferase